MIIYSVVSVDMVVFERVALWKFGLVLQLLNSFSNDVKVCICFGMCSKFPIFLHRDSHRDCNCNHNHQHRSNEHIFLY